MSFSQLFCIFASCKDFGCMKILKNSILLLSVVLLFGACNKEEKATLTLERTALYFSSWGAPSQTIRYTADNAHNVVVRSVSKGWAALVDHTERTITVTAVGKSNEEEEEPSHEGALMIDAMTVEGELTTYYITLYMLGKETLLLDTEGKRANCYVVSEMGRSYAFDATHRPDGEELATKRVAVLWTSNEGIIHNTMFVDGKAEFFVNNEKNDDFVNTNAVIAAYDSADKVVWSWHLWIVDTNPLTAVENPVSGVSFMDRNLGAYRGNNEASQEHSSIHDAYGLYYQWGRKDPFFRPYAYDTSGAESELAYTASGGYAVEKVKEVSSSVGTVDYATSHPLTFITNAACVEEDGDGVGDWLHEADNRLWNDNAKSLYDPCPYGWRVPRAEELAKLTFAADNTADLDTARKQYGWYLESGLERYFFSGCGYRRYMDGKVQNVNYSDAYPYNPEPWEGYYWSSTANEDGSAVSLYFDLITTRSLSHYNSAMSSRRANGMQVRCIKE